MNRALGEETEFKLTIWDKDTLTSDDFLGQLSIDLKSKKKSIIKHSFIFMRIIGEKKHHSLPPLIADLAIDGSDVWLPLRPRKEGESVKGEICLTFSVVPMGGGPANYEADAHTGLVNGREIGDSLLDDDARGGGGGGGTFHFF